MVGSATTALATLPASVRAAVEDHLVPVHLDGGDTLIEQGSEPDGVYLLQTGRLEVRRRRGERAEVLGEVVRGELVGEVALLGGTRRAASVVARRDSDLLHLPAPAFARLVESHPGFLVPFAAQLAQRVAGGGDADEVAPPAAVAVLALHDTEVAATAAAALAEALVAEVGGCVVDAGLPHPDRPGWAHDLEVAHPLVVHLARVGDPEAQVCWALRQVDVVLLVADATASHGRTEGDDLVTDRCSRLAVPVELVLVHPATTEQPRDTKRWLAARSLRRHHHVRVDRATDLARVARLATHRGIGLVLSGGGARAMSSIGVVDALAELGIPVDAVGGTSAGALVAGAVARGWTAERTAAEVRATVASRRRAFDLTLPLTALSAGRRITGRLRDGAGDADLEDLWLDCFCVSTNLSRVRAEVHRRGPAWRAVRASMSVPGVLPPVAHEGDVLVDGGLVDNLPVAELRSAHPGITVVAVDVGVRRELLAGDLPEDTVLDGWRTAVDRVLPWRRTPRIVSLAAVLARLTELGGAHGDDLDRGDLCVRPAVEGVSLLDFSTFDDLVAEGRAAGIEALRPWWEDRRDP